jgi:hypothetical protein
MLKYLRSELFIREIWQDVKRSSSMMPDIEVQCNTATADILK